MNLLNHIVESKLPTIPKIFNLFFKKSLFIYNNMNKNINEILFTPKFCLDIFKVIYNNNEFLFVGRINKEESIAINKIKNKETITEEERNILNFRYGQTGVDILRYKLNKNTKLVEEIISLNDNIKTIKEKIFLNLSKKYGNQYLDIDKQYLYTRKILDYDFITSVIPSLFYNKETLTRTQVLNNLKKIMDVDTFKLNKTKYTLEELQNYFVKLVDIKYYIYHDIGISQQIVDKTTNKRICDHVDFMKNKEEANDFNDRVLDNNYIIFNNIINQTKYDEFNNIKLNQDIYLHYLDDVKPSLPNYKYILNRYFSFANKDSIPDIIKNKNMELLNDLFEHQSSTYRKILTNQAVKNKFTNTINFVKINKKNIIKLNIDLIDFYGKLTATQEIPFINIRHITSMGYRSKRTVLYKLHKPTYSNKNIISSKMLDNWKNGILEIDKEYYDNTEELNFRKDDKFIHMVIKYENNYMTFYINESGDILVIFPIIKKKKKRDREKEKMEENFFNYMDKINEIIIIINNILNNIEESDTPESKIYDINKTVIEIDTKNIKNIKMNFNKSIPVCNLPTLNKIFQNMKLFFYSVSKNKYGFKNVNYYGTRDYIINYIIERYHQDETINADKLEPELKDNFNINKVEIKEIFNYLFTSDIKNNKKLMEKRKNNIDKSEIYFDNILGEQKTIIHFTCQNINQLVFVNNLINLIITGINDKITKKKTPSPKNNKKTMKQSLILPLSTNNENSDNDNSNLSLMNNNNSLNNSLEEEEEEEEEDVEENNIKNEKFMPDKIDELEFKNKKVSQYFKHMRKKYDDDFFKGENYTRSCPAVEDRNPIIISRNLWKYISENKRLSDGLDRINKDDDIDTDKYRIITGSSEDTQNVYICPRIYCVRCMVPIKIDEFIKADNKCPFCSGLPTRIQGNKGTFTDTHTVKIRGHQYWYNTKIDKMNVQCGDCLEQIKYMSYLKNDYKCTKCSSDNINVTEDDLLPYLYSIYKQKLKIPKILINSLSPMYPRKRQSGVFPCCDKSSVEKKEKKNTDNFKEMGTKLAHDEIAMLPDDLSYFLNNDGAEKVREGDFVRTESTKKNKIYYKYRYFQKIKIIAFNKKYDLSKHKLLFRLGTNNVFENNSFVIAVHKLKRLQEHEQEPNKKERSKFNMINIIDNLEPITYLSLNNGNLHEIFRTEVDVDSENQDYNNFFNRLKLIKGLEKESDEVKNLYKSFKNFRNFSIDRRTFKDYTHYVDLLSRKGILFDKTYNIIVLEKVLGTSKEVSVLCPLYTFNKDKDTIFIIKFIDEKNKEFYEPIIKIHFSKEPKSPIFGFKKDDYNFSNIFKIIEDTCSKNLNTPNTLNHITDLLKKSKHNIKIHVINQHFKVIGVVLDNELFIPTIPSGINLNIPVINTKKYEIINIKEYYDREILLSYSEFNKLKKDLVNEIGITSLEEQKIKYSKVDKEKYINGIITKQKLFIPLFDTDNFKGEGNNINRNIEIDNMLYRNNISNLDNRTKKMSQYNKLENIFEEEIISVNRILVKNKEINKNIKKIIQNPVLLKVDRKKLILDEFAKLNIINEYSNRIVDKLLANKKNALKFLRDRLRKKKTRQVRRNDIEVGYNDFNNLRKNIYAKKKYRYQRNIKQFNTRNQKNELLKENYKMNTIRSIANTPYNVNKTLKKEKRIKVPNINASTVDMFGYDRKDEPNLKAGKCVLPFKNRYNSYINKEKTTTKQNTESFYDCLPTSNGPICPTGEIKEDELFTKDTHQYGYCDYSKYFDRQENKVNIEKKKVFNEEECLPSPMFIHRKTKGGVQDKVKLTRKCIINQDRKKTAFDKKNSSEIFKCLKKTKEDTKLYTEKDSTECFVNNI